MRQVQSTCIGCETKQDLGYQYHPMPFMETQIQRIDFAESEEQHEEDEPWQNRTQRQEEFVSQRTDKHRQPKSVGIKQPFDIYKFNFQLLTFYF